MPRSSARCGCHTGTGAATGSGSGSAGGVGDGKSCRVMNPVDAPGAISPEQSSSSTGLPSRPNRKPPSAELRTDELDVPESAGDATLRSSTISAPEPAGTRQSPAPRSSFDSPAGHSA
uniref:Uncharacterized protein n=1 Tax=Zea mays TaxID=4577 RepID=C4J1P7_MAIZE|nr:unknown [Zea mays]